MTALCSPRTNGVLQTSRQIRNQQLRDMGVTPQESYQTGKLGPGDKVECCEVLPSRLDPEEKRYRAVILKVQDHGWYIKVNLRRDEPGDQATEDVILMRDGPPQWGIIEFRITQKVHRPSHLPVGCDMEPDLMCDGRDKRDIFETPQGRRTL